MSEHALWSTVRKELSPYGLFKRIENRVEKGTPDVFYAVKLGQNYSSGWIELKSIPRWPRYGNPVNIGLTSEQAFWLLAAAKRGVNVFVLLKVSKPLSYHLIGKSMFMDLVQHRVTEIKFIDNTILSHVGAFPAQDVLSVLLQP